MLVEFLRLNLNESLNALDRIIDRIYQRYPCELFLKLCVALLVSDINSRQLEIDSLCFCHGFGTGVEIRLGNVLIISHINN